jgi:hypothetical protein
MRVFITATKIYFLALKDFLDPLVAIRCIADDSEISIFQTAYTSDYICEDNEFIVASFALTDFNALTHTLVLKSQSYELNYSTVLEKFRLDQSQMDSHYYVTVNLFGAEMNRLQGNELLYQTLCYLDVMPSSWQFYGGLITLAAFRISENLEESEIYIDSLIEKHRDLVVNFKQVDDHSVRWLISSSFNLAVVCLYLDRIEDAEDLLDKGLMRGYLNRIFPLTYMNYSQGLLLTAVLRFNAGKVKEAAHLFLETADFCSYALSQLFTLRNEFILRHEMDSRVIMDVGYIAFKAGVCLTNHRFASDSKLSTSDLEIQEVDHIDLSVITRRYESHIGYVPPILDQIAQSVHYYKQ